MKILPVVVVLAAGVISAGQLFADKPKDPRIALDSKFPDPGGAKYFAGEITLVEHVNRIGVLRLDRDGTINKYHWDLPHQFHMLPYGAIYYRGAPAELKDIPIGTHLHGKFYLGPEGEFQVNPPESGYVAGKLAQPDLRSVESQYSRVLLLEDDFSFYQRQGAGWKILQISEDLDEITVERVSLETGSPDTPEGSFVGMTGKKVFHMDRGTRVWLGDRFANLEDLAQDQVVQLNLGWVSLLGSVKEDGICRDIWIDEKSRETASLQQRRVHIAHQKRRGVPAIILETESMPGEGARGWVTLEVCAGIAEELLDEIRAAKSLKVRVAEPTLRTYDLGDANNASQLEITEVENPAPGSSGLRIRMHMYEMLEGNRKGRTVRLALNEWEIPESPREERLWQNDLRIFEVGPKPASDREGPPKTD